MSLLTINGGNLDYNVEGSFPLYNSVYSFTGFSLEYLYHSGNIRYVFNTGFGLIDARLTSGSGLNLDSYPFYRARPSGTIPINHLKFIDETPVYQVHSNQSGVVYFTNTGNITLSTQSENIQYSQYITPTINTVRQTPVTISGYLFNPADHLLFCYNANSQDSIDLKNYYFQTRPELANANILPLYCNPATSGDMTDMFDYLENIRKPISNYILDSEKPIRYVTLLYDIGVRLTGVDRFSLSYLNWPDPYDIYNNDPIEAEKHFKSGEFLPLGSVSASLSSFFYFSGIYTNQRLRGIRNSRMVVIDQNAQYIAQYISNSDDLFAFTSHSNEIISSMNTSKPWKKYSVGEFPSNVLITHITARNKIDVSGYIKKIGNATLYNNYYRRGNKSIKNFYIFASAIPNISGEKTIQEMINSGDPAGYYGHILTGINPGMSVKTFFPNYSLNGFASEFNWIRTPMISGRDIAGITHNGIHTTAVVAPMGLSEYLRGSYAYSNQVRFSGDNWYITNTAESFNGQNYTVTGDNSIGQQRIFGQDTAFGGHGTAFSWLRPDAFGGTGYENCPVGLSVHSNEPGSLLSMPPIFYSLWFSGYPFIECSSAADNSSNNNKYCNLYHIGDPLVVI